jgi:hypothetical protein
LWELSQRLQNELAKNEHVRSVLTSLLQNQALEDEEMPTEFNKAGCLAEMNDDDILASL